MAGIHHPRRRVPPVDIEPHSRLDCHLDWCGLPPFRYRIHLDEASTTDLLKTLVGRLKGGLSR